MGMVLSAEAESGPALVPWYWGTLLHSLCPIPPLTLTEILGGDRLEASGTLTRGPLYLPMASIPELPGVWGLESEVRL